MFISCLILFLRDPGAVYKSVVRVPDVKVAAGASVASITLTLGSATDSVKRTGRAVGQKLKSMYNPHTLIGG